MTFGIAVYQSEKYLKSCVESILCQAKGDFEILLVDDGSTDNSAGICDAFAADNSHVRVIHQKNLGVSAVRNRVIAEARGDWICFVDGDDKFAPGAVNVMEQNLFEQYDIVYFDLQYFMFDHAVSQYKNFVAPVVLTGDGISALALSTMYSARGTEDFVNRSLRSACAKAFRRDFLLKHALMFGTELIYGEDVLFNLCCLEKCRKIKLVRRPFYLYRQNPASTVHRYHPEMVKYNTALSHRLWEFSGRMPVGGEMQKRYALRCIADISSVCMLCLFHPDNPDKKRVRAREFLQFLQLDWCRFGLAYAEEERLTSNDQKAFAVLKKGDFSAAVRYYRHKNRMQKIKRVLNRTGLVTVYKFFWDRIKRGV